MTVHESVVLLVKPFKSIIGYM